MARIIQSQFPIDLTPSVAVGYGFPLDGDAVFIPTFTTREQLKANLVNYLLTNRGERLFRPDFGGDLRNLLATNPVGGPGDISVPIVPLTPAATKLSTLAANMLSKVTQYKSTVTTSK